MNLTEPHQNHLTATHLIDDLCLRNRAYNLLYALGADSSTVRTLIPGEAAYLVLVAQSVEAGDRLTERQRQIAATVKPHHLRYVTTGRI
jgi:hypothetical protein